MKFSQNRRATLFGGKKFLLAAALTVCLYMASSAVAQTDCHAHGTETWCIGPDGKESLYPSLPTGTPTPTSGGVKPQETHDDHDDHAGENCHFHAGVEHCGDDDDEDFDRATDCVVRDRDYNRGLRTGALFIVLATSSIAVFLPIFLARFTKLALNGIVFTIIKQFGTGVIVATALIHLLTHANLMFTNKCIGDLGYEATGNAIAMAGVFLSFLVEYIGDRFVHARAQKKPSDNPIVGVSPKEVPSDNNSEENANGVTNVGGHGHGHGVGKDDKVGVAVMEAGIIFHSILIGVTTVVAGDSVFSTLLVVIIFHQMFEGLALGSRISLLPTSSASFTLKFIMGGAFAIITPIGMAIGLGVLNKFNGNDKQTLITMGTLDALSAGILLWVGLVEMWAADWLYGDLKTSGFVKTLVAFVSLMAGMILMGVLGKWA